MIGTPPSSPTDGHRPDVQGLRALAVTAVILDHLIGKPAGGFVGVDIFFVISGFLITGLLLREYARNGSISFVGFYRRRAKRILPAAVLVLLVTVGAMFTIYTPGRALQTLWDALSAVLFVANWRFAATGTDYFQSAVPPSPLQHYWSLAVEEQFYFVWPWLLLAIFLITSRRGWTVQRGRRVAVTAMGAITVLSFVWGWFETQTNPSVAYFSTLSRAWELGIGALVAVLADRLAAIPHSARPILAWLGLAGIAGSLLVVSNDKQFPVPWGLLPVLSAAVLIAAGTGVRPRYLWPLTNPISRYVGDISYSLYLWHWPAIILVRDLVPGSGARRDLIALALTGACAALSYHFLEDPIRRSGWLERKKTRAKGARSPRIGLVGAGALVVLLALAALTVQARVASASSNSYSSQAAAVPSSQGALSSAIGRSLRASQWPTLAPTTDVLPVLFSPALGESCFNNWDLTDADRCTRRPAGASKLAVVLGDSVAMSWVPGIDRALEPAGYAVHALGFSNCPVVLADIRLDAYTAKCSAEHSAVLKAVVAMKPDLIVVSDSIYGISRLGDGASPTNAQHEWTSARIAALDRLKSRGARVVLLETNPDGLPISECQTNFSTPASCTVSVSDAWRELFAADSVAARDAGVQIIDPRAWFCVEDLCPAFVGTTPVRWDAIHLTRQYSAALGPMLRKALIQG